MDQQYSIFSPWKCCDIIWKMIKSGVNHKTNKHSEHISLWKYSYVLGNGRECHKMVTFVNNSRSCLSHICSNPFSVWYTVYILQLLKVLYICRVNVLQIGLGYFKNITNLTLDLILEAYTFVVQKLLQGNWSFCKQFLWHYNL